MNDAAVSRPGAHAQIRIREPSGERTLGAAVTVGGDGSDVIVPGAAGVALRIERREGEWVAIPREAAGVRIDGAGLAGARELRIDDVLGVGDAQLVVTELSGTQLRLDVHHLVGNDTIAPVATLPAPGHDASDEDVEILPAPLRTADAAAEAPEQPAAIARAGRSRGFWAAIAAGFALLIAAVLLFSTLRPVMVDVAPADASISTPGTFLSFHIGDTVFVASGQRVIRAEREGYVPAQTVVQVGSDKPATARLRLAKLPGELQIDTNGVPVVVSVDGVEVGRAPGVVEIAPGRHTVTLRAPMYLDHEVTLDIQGAGARQELKAILEPSWGTVKVSSATPGARVTVDGKDAGVAPASAEVASGVRQVRVTAPGYKPWESNVVVKAGETLSLGPIRLGQPDAVLTVRSQPAGAEVTVAGTFRGRTPVSVDLPAGISHDVVVTLPGYENWSRSVFAEAGGKLALDAKLQPVLSRVSVQGEPEDAEVFVDGRALGSAPRTLELTSTEHTIEVRKEGFQPWKTSITPASGLERKLEYKLVSADRALALQETAPTITTKSGYVLRLVPGGTFRMGSERREQGRRPNEGFREVTLKRPYYIGVREVTNKEFREFRAKHASGYIEKQTLDLDAHPVVKVTWDDAAAYCNWLSEREGLPPAYERRDGGFHLKRPVTIGYRLPTEAEWEYAARFVAPGKVQRFSWGDALPVVPHSGNVAGSEAKALLGVTLDGYEDDYPAVAPVGKFQPNALGLHDIGGNVSEWVNDYYLSFVDSTPVTDPLGPEPTAMHVVRGANWKSATVGQLRLAYRDSGDAASEVVGFRIARYAE